MTRIRGIEESELYKVWDALGEATRFHILRDEMNAVLHKSEVRYSPLTSTLIAEETRLGNLLGIIKEGAED